MEWMLLPLKRYADFSGRSRRKEYWMFFLLQLLVNIAFFGLMIVVAMNGPDEIVSASDTIPKIDGTDHLIPLLVIMGLWGLFWLGVLIPNAAVIVRRFHDQNISGIVGILLYVGTLILTLPGIVILIFMCIDGQKGDNQYGKDPKMADNIGDVFR